MFSPFSCIQGSFLFHLVNQWNAQLNAEIKNQGSNQNVFIVLGRLYSLILWRYNSMAFFFGLLFGNTIFCRKKWNANRINWKCWNLDLSPPHLVAPLPWCMSSGLCINQSIYRYITRLKNIYINEGF